MGVVITFVIASIDACKGMEACDVVGVEGLVVASIFDADSWSCKSFGDCLRACFLWRIEDGGEGFWDGTEGFCSVVKVAACLGGSVFGFDFLHGMDAPVFVFFGFKWHRVSVMIISGVDECESSSNTWSLSSSLSGQTMISLTHLVVPNWYVSSGSERS